jgi:SAM-dependent methyltransferase
MKRILERELMDGDHQSRAYAGADFSTSNQFFVDALIREFRRHLRAVVDIGCGPADVMIRLARAVPDVSITAIDGSGPMISLARDAVSAAGLERRITLVHVRVPAASLTDHVFDAVLSKDLLHHLPDPAVLWGEVVRLGKPGGAVQVMDLVRPESPEAAQRIVESASDGDDPILRRDFYNSLCAAFTLDEVRDQLDAARLDLGVAQVSERHMLIKGWLPQGS